MVNKTLKIVIIIASMAILNGLSACPICTDSRHKSATPFFVDNNQTANNPRVDKIKQILEAMKSQQ